VNKLDTTKAAMRAAEEAYFSGSTIDSEPTLSSNIESSSSSDPQLRPSSTVPSPYIMKLQKLEEELHKVDSCVDDLRDYRGHIGRHLSECEFASLRLENLGCDEAEVTSDFKMKILACFF
jgi:hypothetical protein